MKKLLTTLLVTTLVLSCIGCENGKKTVKYPYDYIGFYDTETRQCISINDKKEDIEKILGKSEDNSDNLGLEYSNNLCISYENKTPCTMTVHNDFETPTRYELPDGINVNSTVTEFIDLYPFVYEISNLGNNVGIFIKETSGEYCVINKNTVQQSLKDISKKANNFNLYWIQLSYSSYSEIDYISIYALNSPYMVGETFADRIIDVKAHK